MRFYPHCSVSLCARNFWWLRRCELGDVRQSQTAFDRADLLDGIFETVLTELLVLNILKFVVHLIELLACHCLFPSWKDDRVFSRSVVAIHEHEGLKTFCQWFSITWS